MKEYPKPELLESDSDEMKEVFAWLEAENISFWRPSHYQLKVAHINFYPDKGTIHIDGAPRANQQRGFKEFQEMILKYESSKLNSLRIDDRTINSHSGER